MSIITTLEADASKVLNWITGVQTKTTTLGPTAVAGIGTILGAVATAIKDAGSAIGQSGLNIALDAQTAEDVKTVWNDIESAAAALGIKL